VTEGDKPATWAAITSFVSEHQGNKRRQFKGSSADVAAVDLVIFYVPEGLPVPGFNGGRDVPLWNTLALAKDEDGLEKSPWVKAAFTFADEWLCDDGAVLVFYPDSKFVSGEVNAWAKWTNFKEEMKWVVVNGIPLSKPDFP
jgi:hypothetical protein